MMSKQLCISVIVPFYNAESHIKKCLDLLLNQDFIKPFEIIMVDDASTDNSQNIIKMQNSPLIKLYSLPSNAGPSAARNVGLKNAKGEYVFFLDVDDTISTSILKILYNHAKENDFDLVFSDKKRIENSQNRRENIFVYSTDKTFSDSDITEAIKQRISNPLHTEGVVGLHGKLIKRSIISQNNLSFEEKLKFLEDEVFMFDILAFTRSMKYVRKQLYTYNINSDRNVKSARTESFVRPFPISFFKLMKNHAQNSFRQRGLSAKESEKLGDQAFIYWIIFTLVLRGLSIAKGKMNLEEGIKYRKKLIDDLTANSDISKSIRNYSPSREESQWIPRALAWRSSKLLKFTLDRRVKEILRNRK
jgi:glycosyltransferase involved in cell wall biosynthesis